MSDAKKWMEAYLREQGYDVDKLKQPITEEEIIRFSNAEDDDAEDDFPVEWYRSFLAGHVIFHCDEPGFDYEAFVRHAKKVCGYE